MRVSLIVAVAENGVIGRDNRLPWRIPDDLRHFKALTMGKPVIMGRRTHQSIGRPLPGRLNIVLSRDPAFQAPGVCRVGSVEAALAAADRPGWGEEAMVIGGAEIYRLFLPLADRLYLTEVHRRVEGDARFPAIAPRAWRERSRDFRAGDGDVPSHSFVTLERSRPD